MPAITLGIPADGDRSTPCQLMPDMVNRHGIICGATGTGKTVTLRLLAEQLCQRGLPVFVTDFKGDLSGLAAPGGDSAKVRERLPKFGLDDSYFRANPLELWGPTALPLRTTVSELGPEILAQMLGLNDNQSGLLQLLFKMADEQGLLLLDWKDLQALIDFVADQRQALAQAYGTISPASLGAIKRKFLAIERTGAAALFGEPALQIEDLLNGARIHLFDASKLNPRVYGTLLLWLLAELYENLPESGGGAIRIALCFDEAHLLFDGLPKDQRQQVAQIVKLIRSRGVGIFFITQNPLDIPEEILAQLGNRIQHTLRAYTPTEQRAVRAAARSFRANPGFDTAEVIGQLAVGEALVSCLDENGVPQPVERVLIQPPASRLAPLTVGEAQQLLRESPLAARYGQSLDRESAYEQLQKRRKDTAAEAPERKEIHRKGKEKPSELDRALGKMADSFGRQIGRELVRGLLGALTGRR
ncbi:helicase HerA-like domain-containing protein [Microbulbifer hainanensis]|uniref:helicase HerA-like domain-containing protein n=1 Tax=Microbulbifer hainanensis TaxID=2735675 RepID=UPI0018681EAB|nr:helicase HerA-like domain-containing protein [Microbulbifer hainanensis]